MPLVNMKPLLRDAMDNGYAVAAFNLVDYNTTKAMVKAAEELNAPVICQTSAKTIKYFSHKEIVSWVRTVAEDSPVPVVLHLDHCKDIPMIEACAKAGWTSIMIDASELPFEQNLAESLKVREIAEKYGVGMEAELGQIMGVEDDEHVAEEDSILTDPGRRASASATRSTCRPSPARSAPRTASTRASRWSISTASRRSTSCTRTPMALHGGTGLSDETFAKAIARGGGQDQHLDQPQACLGQELRRLPPRQPEGLRAAAGGRCAVPGVQGDVPRLHREVRRQGSRQRLPHQARQGGLIPHDQGTDLRLRRRARRYRARRRTASASTAPSRNSASTPNGTSSFTASCCWSPAARSGCAAYFDEFGWPDGRRHRRGEGRADPRAAPQEDRDHRRTWSPRAACPCGPASLRIIDEAIAAGVKLGVCTTSNPKFIDAVLDLFGPERKAAFEFVHAGDVVAKKKPAPDIYLLALETLGLPAERLHGDRGQPQRAARGERRGPPDADHHQHLHG